MILPNGGVGLSDIDNITSLWERYVGNLIDFPDIPRTLRSSVSKQRFVCKLNSVLANKVSQ